MEPEPQSEESATESLRQRLARRGRLERYEEDLARRRRERFRNPQLAYDDEYRVRQRLAAQKVFNQFFGVADPPTILTAEHHHNPSFSAMGGRIGQAQTAMERREGRPVDTAGNVVDTKTEVLKDTK
tara:strand:+ start:154 stop:534 length:381 start_codon:yes stop_codon:yes gene_type:complete